ncbi:MAG TPA: TIGR03435 family protein [Vicinamibacterales bacterium]|nr:TIGR03435 family protein [Vicinamibacterales bacterium]
MLTVHVLGRYWWHGRQLDAARRHRQRRVKAPAPDGTATPAPPSGDSVSLYTAVQEQLGLRLDAQRGPVDVLVIESAQRPVED